MIISNIIGGLGNQMFQYAAARALSIRKGVPLKLDVSAFTKYGLHNGFELANVFSCPVDLAEPEDVWKVLGWQAPVRVQNLISRPFLSHVRSRALVIDASPLNRVAIDSAPDSCYLKGYWQSENYFASAAAQIRQDFTFKAPMNELNAMAAEKILSANAVSIHVRRGDYLTDKKSNATHGLCSPQYYKKSVQYISESTENPEFFIFSDDIEWSKENLKIDAAVHYIDFNSNAYSYNDMRLMSICKHHIIANSSFSWWGAWLNPSLTKLVVAPEPWFADPNLEAHDLIPESWTREVNEWAQ